MLLEYFALCKRLTAKYREYILGGPRPFLTWVLPPPPVTIYIRVLLRARYITISYLLSKLLLRGGSTQFQTEYLAPDRAYNSVSRKELCFFCHTRLAPSVHATSSSSPEGSYAYPGNMYATVHIPCIVCWAWVPY